MAKEFLLQNNIHYTEKNISRDMEAMRDLQRRNISGVPAFFVGDDVILGLDKQKLLQLVDHRIRQCPKCAQKLRVPTGKGSIEVVCPKCGDTFKMEI